jgi:hypothetical protein
LGHFGSPGRDSSFDACAGLDNFTGNEFGLMRQPAQEKGERGGERDALLSILRSIAREPDMSSFSVIAFNLEQAQVIFEQDNVKQIDLSAPWTERCLLKLGYGSLWTSSLLRMLALTSSSRWRVNG